jgi:hypothetical protein
MPHRQAAHQSRQYWRRRKVRAVVRRAQEQRVPIRIGVNAGSLERRLIEKYGFPTPQGMVESALYHIQILEDLGFTDTIVSLKASNVKMTVAAYRLLAKQVNYPFHLGITEAGTQFSGTVKSCVGMGMLLAGESATNPGLTGDRSCGRSARRLRVAEITRATQPGSGDNRLPHVRTPGSRPVQNRGRN